jgi:membrane protease YdiL (CAAX protease family)
LLICCLLTRDRTFRWNLPATRPQWLGEVAWGVALIFVCTGANRLFEALARDIGLDSSPAPWDQWLTNAELLLAFRITGPLVALHEELLFRVYLQSRLTLIFRGWSLISVPTCAGLFALTHNYAPVETAGVFGWGLFLGISYQVSRKVPRIVIAHALALAFRPV